MMTDQLLQSMSSLSGEVPQFVELAERYKCEICHQVLQTPMMTTCGHRGCRSCFQELVTKNDDRPVQCPGRLSDCSPNITMGQLLPDYGTYREIQRLETFCLNEKYGCRSVQPWNKLKDHLVTCPFAMEDCVNKGFGCKARVSKIKLAAHLENECQFRTKECPHCEVRFQESKLEEHIRDQCPSVSIICPYKCGEQSIQRGEVEDHKAVCKAKPKECQLKNWGCPFFGTEDEVRQHEAHNSHIHLLCKQLDSIKKENRELRTTVQELQSRAGGGAVGGAVVGESELMPKIAMLDKMQMAQGNTMRNTQKMVAEINSSVQNLTGKQEFLMLRENVQAIDKRLSSVKQSSAGDVKQEVIAMERSLGMTNMRLQEMDLRLQCVETANYDGMLIWKIRDFRRRKTEASSGRTVSLYSQPFYTSRYGYKACSRIYLNGDGMGKGTHISLFFVILRGDFDALLPWPFRQKVTMTLIDQDGGKKNIVDSFRADPTSNSFKRPITDMNIASGCPLFASQSTVETSPFLRDDCIFLKIHVNCSDLKDASQDTKSL